MQYLVVSWDDIHLLCIDLAKKIRIGNYSPDIIVAIARGGWVPARIVSDILENPNVASMRTEFYLDVAETSSHPRISQDVSTSVTGKRVLVVDDVADTGKSLTLIRERLMKQGAKEVRVATIHYKLRSITKPEYYVAETDAWIIYPYECFEFMRSRIRRMKSEESWEDVRQHFSQIGIPQNVIEMFLANTNSGTNSQTS